VEFFDDIVRERSWRGFSGRRSPFVVSRRCVLCIMYAQNLGAPRIRHSEVWYFRVERRGRGLFLYLAQFLHVNGLHHLLAVGYRRFLESLAAAEFLYDTGFFKFAFEFFESFFDVVALFYLYDDHFW